MSLAEIEQAVERLTPEELTQLAAFIAQRENRAWDDEIDRDFSPGGRLSAVADEVRRDIADGQLGDMP